MKKILLATLLMISGATYAQNVGIGTNKPDESAILDLHSTKKGFLLPRLNEKQRMLIPAPAEGLIVYQTDSNQGIYIYQSGKWNNITSSNSSPSSRFQNANAVGTLTANYLTVGDANGDVVSSSIYYDSSTGFYGIGTTTPASKLDLQGVLTLKSGYFGGGGVKFGYSADTSSRSWRMVNDYYSFGDFGFFQSNSQTADGVANSTSRLFFTKEGNVGIGTNFPNTKLYVNGDVTVAGSAIVATGYGGAGGIRFNAAGDESSRKWKMINDFNYFGDFGFFQSNAQTGGEAAANYTSRFYISSSGDVAFGSTNPIAKLHVEGSSYVSGNASVTGNSTIGDKLAVGFGLNHSPTTSLDVSGSIKQTDVTSAILKADADGKLVGSSLTEVNAASANTLKVDSKSEGYLAVGDFTNSGLTSFPSGYRLIVQDGILTEKMNLALKSSASWADYVFEPTYQLMPLNEVEEFVKENKHLPNVPSADDMVSNGLDVGQTSKMFMEKIEELTLYMIELKKEVEALKAENNSLRNK